MIANSQRKKVFLRLRDSFWNYPDFLIGREGLFSSLISLYRLLRPFSHIFVLLLFFFTLGFFNYSYGSSIINTQKDTLIEGVIVGEGTLSGINPLLPTNNQLENDLARLIYYSLVRVDASGKVIPILAKNWEKLDEEEKSYIIHLREDVYWHDGEKFTADDVIATFNVLRALGEENQGGVSRSVEVALNMKVTKIDAYSLQFEQENINPTFFEDIDVGILPKHILDTVSLSTFSWAEFNLKPVGTGPFIFHSFKDEVITLIANEGYFESKPKIKTLQIILFSTADEAIEALKSGEIHVLADPSTTVLSSLEGWDNIYQIASSNIYRRYWAIYFNLKDSSPEIFKDKVIRQAISASIDREALVSKISTAGEEALGPIPINSWAYNQGAKRYRFDQSEAKKLLEDNGWVQKEVDKRLVRMKDNEILRFELSYLDKSDRQIVAEQIRSDLGKLGVIVKLDPRSSSDLNDALIATRNFEAILYGVETPIDPDRIRLWHSDAIEYPGLNISSYVSEQSGAVIGSSNTIERVSIIDAALEKAESSLDEEVRKGGTGRESGYLKFQEVLMDECPAVFLYHPVFTYATHSRVSGVDLSEMTAPEDRYLSVTKWKIE